MSESVVAYSVESGGFTVPRYSVADNTVPADDDTRVFPYRVVWDHSIGDYRKATPDEISDQLETQVRVSRDTAAWSVDNKPDKLDKWWARRVEIEHMVSRAPYPLRGTVKGRFALRTRHAACDTLLTVVPAGYGRPANIIEW
jgi:hypothetical protein